MNPLEINSHTRAMLIEQIMTLIGRAEKEPRKFRRMLEQETAEQLSARYEKLFANDP